MNVVLTRLFLVRLCSYLTLTRGRLEYLKHLQVNSSNHRLCVLYLSIRISHHRGCSCLHEGSIIFLVHDPSYLTFHKEMAKLHRNDLGLD